MIDKTTFIHPHPVWTRLLLSLLDLHVQRCPGERVRNILCCKSLKDWNIPYIFIEQPSAITLLLLDLSSGNLHKLCRKRKERIVGENEITHMHHRQSSLNNSEEYMKPVPEELANDEKLCKLQLSELLGPANGWAKFIVIEDFSILFEVEQEMPPHIEKPLKRHGSTTTT